MTIDCYGHTEFYLTVLILVVFCRLCHEGISKNPDNRKDEELTWKGFFVLL